MGAIDIRELAELRYTIEIGAIELAAMRATDKQLLSLSKLADEYAASMLPNYSGREQDQIELDFHQTILKASHNTMLIQMHHVLIAFFSRAILEFPEWNMANKDKVSWEHQAIAEALTKRNTERARILLSGHLEQIILDK
ncbi:MAG: FadR family transcriptional regulator [Victivallaceae bacterium]|nr:FadR family transcriptional regulator [Victivallaceae bacterium]